MARQVGLIVRTPHDEQNPALGRLEQLVGNAEPSSPIIGPTDHNFMQLIALREPLERAAKYVPASELERLKALDERRNQLVSKAFQTAQLPAALVEFETKAHEHNLLDDQSEHGHSDRYRIKLGGWAGFAITYKETSPNNTLIKVASSRLIGSEPMVEFNYRAKPDDGQNRFELISANPRAIKRSDKLVELLEDTIKDAEEAKLRQHVRQHIQQRYY